MGTWQEKTECASLNERQPKAIDKINNFLSNYSHLAGSREGFPAICLTLQDARELMIYLDSK